MGLRDGDTINVDVPEHSLFSATIPRGTYEYKTNYWSQRGEMVSGYRTRDDKFSRCRIVKKNDDQWVFQKYWKFKSGENHWVTVAKMGSIENDMSKIPLPLK